MAPVSTSESLVVQPKNIEALSPAAAVRAHFACIPPIFKPLEVPDHEIPDGPLPHDTIEAERAYRKQRLAASLRVFGALGFTLGDNGHFSCNDPEFPGHLLINPHDGETMRYAKASDIILINPEGDVMAGGKPVMRAAWAIHVSVHEARPDVMAACHMHTPYGVPYSALSTPPALVPLEPAHHALTFPFPVYAGPPLIEELPECRDLARAMGPSDVVVMESHGLCAAGRSVEAALWNFITAEGVCKENMKAIVEGVERVEAERISSISDNRDLYAFKQGWKLIEKIVRTEPDVLL
ncbi:hypothetical protein HDU93_000559 [Gonapodya sp. JEL0774]|nr:hypothetical protein HDU93_000559 [Gonapodya sp. JEL0774]